MSTGKKTVRDLVEEAKKRVVLLLICVFGLSYLMSLTSSSVWVNFPAAAVLIILCRYLSLDLDIHKRSATGSKSPLITSSSTKKSIEDNKSPLEKPNWRSKVNSPAVEDSIDQFTRHLVSEWVTDLWYSRITPDRDGPEELLQIINNVFGEISSRARDINLIDLLTRDIINLFCNHLELFRSSISKIGRQKLKNLPLDHKDIQLKQVMASENKLHPALFSAKAEHKVLHHLVNGLMLITFKTEDLQCSFFRYTVRELLACAVFRPILNLANPRIINEKIESLVLSLAKNDKGSKTSEDQAVTIKPNGPAKSSVEQLSGSLDRSAVGVELVQYRHGPSKISSEEHVANNRASLLKDKYFCGANSVGAHDTARMPGAMTDDGAQLYLSSDTHFSGADKTGSSISKGEWGQILDIISQRKRQALAPEHLENVWAKGRNYRRKEGTKQLAKQYARGASTCSNDANQFAAASTYLKKDSMACLDVSMRHASVSCQEDQSSAENTLTDFIDSVNHPTKPNQGKTDFHREGIETTSESSYETEEDESSNVTGLDSPGTRVWDSKNKRNASVSHIRHPLETSELHLTKIRVRNHIRHPRALRTPSGRKKTRSINQKTLWQENEKMSFLLGEERDLLNECTEDAKVEEMSDNPDIEINGRIHSGEAASSSMSSISASKSYTSSLKSPENSVLEDSFLKLRCEVFGANIVKSGSGTFAVYSIAVTDANNHSWSIKRRFRHFEELHRRLKEFPEYNLNLPPKHFLSSGLDVPVVQERCKLLDRYLKRLLKLPTISGSIEVWDFLSVDSQTYMFSDSLSIIQTLSVDLDDKPHEKNVKVHNSAEVTNSQLTSQSEDSEQLSSVGGANVSSMHLNKNHTESEYAGMRKRKADQHVGVNVNHEGKTLYHDDSGKDSENIVQMNISHSSKLENLSNGAFSGTGGLPKGYQISEAVDDPTLPTEWAPPNLSVPILDLIDVIFQLKDGGWIRRQAFWVAKQLLQLGMGDAFDDWLIEKILLLRKGSVVAKAINHIEQILWPDGIFITKHPNRKPSTPIPSLGNMGSRDDFLKSEQQLECAKFVYELIIDKAPAALVGLVGRKEYEQCAEDLYFFLQSVVCLKQLAVELLELLLLSTFPELDDVIRQCHEGRNQFGVFQE